jgi:hypothetical protein
MELPINRVTDLYREETEMYENNNIRYVKTPYGNNVKGPQEDISKMEWKALTKETAPGFSALAYFFAKEMYNKTKVPVGIINSSWGGSTIEAWMSEEALKDFPRNLLERDIFSSDEYRKLINQSSSMMNTFWDRSLYKGGTRFHDTGIFFAAYVNEENPMIDHLLREALNTRIVNRFLGYQGSPEAVDNQVYALWNVLQKRNFRYSSVSNTSLSSNVVFSQRVRTFDDALESSQINCVDGSVLFASLLRAINIEPILVRTPGHMFVGYYTDANHKDMKFLETTIVESSRSSGKKSSKSTSPIMVVSRNFISL